MTQLPNGIFNTHLLTHILGQDLRSPFPPSDHLKPVLLFRSSKQFVNDMAMIQHKKSDSGKNCSQL